jgi:HK97 family phage prohead protease
MNELMHMRATLLRAPEKGRLVSWRANTADLDRHGTIIKPSGAKTDHFLRNPIFAWAHDAYGGLFSKPDPANIIGRVTEIRAGEHALDVDVEFAPEEVNPRAEMLFRMVKAEFLNAVSIGWRPLKWHEEDRDGRIIRVFDEWELLEISLVPIPSNPHALVLARAMAAALPDVAPSASGTAASGTGTVGSVAAVRIDSPPTPWGRYRLIVDDEESQVFVADAAGRVLGELERDEALRDLLLRGVVPSNVSTDAADEDTPWTKPTLEDFTDEPWEDLTSREKRRIAGHYAWSPAMPPERFSDLKLPHHRPSDVSAVERRRPH